MTEDALRNRCPRCREVLAAVVEKEFVTWHCPNGHGLGCTVHNARGHLQLDEIKKLMTAGHAGAVALDYRSPSLGFPMRVTTIIADDDEIIDSVGLNPREVEAFVSYDEGFFWFTYEEFAKLPGEGGRDFAGVLHAGAQFGATAATT